MRVIPAMFYVISFVLLMTVFKEIRFVTMISKKGMRSLSERTRHFGKEMTVKMQLFVSVIMIAFGYLLCRSFSLDVFSSFYVISLAVLLFPSIVLWKANFIYRQKCFFDTMHYLQQMIVLFKINKKVYTCLKECALLPLGNLNSAIETAIEKLESGVPLRLSMQPIETLFPHFIMMNLNALMCAVEEYGSDDFYHGLDLINEDIEVLIEDCLAFKMQQIDLKNKICILCFLACVVALMSKNMLMRIDPAMNNEGYQCVCSIFLMVLILTVLMAHRIYAEEWIDRKEML